MFEVQQTSQSTESTTISAVAQPLIKVHIALNVTDVEKSVAFYSAMFGVKPVKHKPGYAKFDIAQPALNLTLNHVNEVPTAGALSHLGIQAPSTSMVLEARERLNSRGLTTSDEMEADCCYALQDKIWLTDPDGYRWEVFTVKIDDTRPELRAGLEKECSLPLAKQSCCA
ncbi:MAG: glyoxalase/bleomycin resistance/dioxygenase family protein [Blastocatellia bacterium AA13]|nr:MAG: glyoxalase/bleomycin resistance/dioxygenase family protein [Blastocatellia bacterium AA13]